MTEARVTESPDLDPVNPVIASAEVGVAPIESSSPGAVLRRAREARGQSVADVAQVIRFSVHQIEALERDDYASLPGATSVRGMVRNYARVLRLDAAPLLAQLDPAVPVPEADVRPPANMGEAEKPALMTRLPIRIVGAGILLLVLGMAGYWYASSMFVGTAPSAPVEAGAAGKLVGADPTLAVAPSVKAVVVNEPASIVAPAGSPPPHLGPRVEFDDRSWIEVRDAANKVVFVGEYPAGTVQDIEGTPPFQFWIGRASVVRVFMGERSIDIKPYIREEVARFSLE